MTKRRTRKQKESAKHTFTVAWDEPTTNPKTDNSIASKTKKSSKKSDSTNLQNMASIKKDLVKSVVVFAIIMSALVVYSIAR